MKIRSFTRLLLGCFLSVVIDSQFANAQVDPSSAILLRSSPSRVDSSQGDLDSSRYTVRPGPRVNNVKKVKPGDSNYVTKPEKKENAKIVIKESKKPEEPAPKKKEQPLYSQQDLRAISEQVAEYKRQLDPRDQRHNILELSIAPTYVYNDADSDYWYRDYTSHGVGLDIHAGMWITPFLGLSVDYLFTLGADVRSEPGSNKRVEAEHQWLNFDFKFRRYFRLSRKSPYLTFGLGYKEYKFVVPKDEANRVRLTTNGIKLSMEAGVPKSSTFHWLMGAELVPRADHAEEATQLNLKSGTDPNSDVLGIWFGGKFQFDRGHQMFWKVYHTIEKNLYTGTANTNDPISGTAPEGVSITNSVSLFQLGVTWAD